MCAELGYLGWKVIITTYESFSYLFRSFVLAHPVLPSLEIRLATFICLDDLPYAFSTVIILGRIGAPRTAKFSSTAPTITQTHGHSVLSKVTLYNGFASLEMKAVTINKI